MDQKTKTYKELLEEAYTRLRQADIESFVLDSQLLLEEVTGADRISFYTHPEKALAQKETEQFYYLLKRREQREPIAYILGKKEFMGLDFKVCEGVLIPRPDTEVIVESVLEITKNQKPLEILDLCCGSGAIGLSAKNYSPKDNLTLSDISDLAVQVTSENKDRLKLDATVIQGDLFNKIKKSFDIIVSNPPYIKEEEIATLEDEIKKWEPELALNGGKDGYFYYKRIIEESSSFLRPKGYLVFEIGIGQDQRITQYLKENEFSDIRIKKDLSGIPRAIIAQKKE